MGCGQKILKQVSYFILDESNRDSVVRFISQIEDNLQDINSFLSPPDEILHKCLISKISIGACHGEEFIGCRLSYVPGLNRDNLGYFFNLKISDLKQLVQYRGIAVSPTYQNFGIANEMHKVSLRMIKCIGYKFIAATCHPNNANSLHLLKKCGFTHNKISYTIQGKERYILMKRIRQRTETARNC